MGQKKSISRGKLKAVNEEERLQKRKEHFKYFYGNPLKMPVKPSPTIINGQLDIMLRQFTEKKLDQKLKIKMKNWKIAGLDEISSEVWKTRRFDDIFLRLCCTVYRKYRRQIGKRLPSLTQERWHRNHEELWSYYTYCNSCKDFSYLTSKKYRSMTIQIMTILLSIEEVREKYLEVTLEFVDFLMAFDSQHE